jgi:hypothetical protein
MDTKLLNVCNGKTKSNGCLNLPEFRQEMSVRYPAYQKQIGTMTRPELNELCRELISNAPSSQNIIRPNAHVYITDSTVQKILHELRPEETITESAMVSLQQLLKRYVDTLGMIPDVPTFLNWIRDNVSGDLGKHAYAIVVKTITKNGKDLRDPNPELMTIVKDAFLEYLIAECLTLASNLVHNGDRQITTSDLKRAISNDRELTLLFE